LNFLESLFPLLEKRFDSVLILSVVLSELFDLLTELILLGLGSVELFSQYRDFILQFELLFGELDVLLLLNCLAALLRSF